MKPLPPAELRALAENVITVLKWANKCQSKPEHYFAWDGRIFRIQRAGDRVQWNGNKWWHLSYATDNFSFTGANIRWKKTIPSPYKLSVAILEATERLNTESVVKG